MECNVCNIPEDKILKELKYSTVSLGRPHHKGHIKVVLKNHKEDILEMTRGEANNFFNDLIKVSKVVNNVLKPDKMNYALLGNWVPHLHWHIIQDSKKTKTSETRPQDRSNKRSSRRKNSLPKS